MIKGKTFFAGLILAALTACGPTGKSPSSDVIKVIFETDMGNDVDDALALDMLYKYMDAGKVDLLGVMINKDSEFSPEYVDIMNTWYGYPDIPIGIIHDGAECDDARNYAQAVCEINGEDGSPAFRRTLKGDYGKLPEAPALYRKILAAQEDNSVTIVSVGFSTNLARLLDTPGDKYSPLDGKELVARKVRLLCTMAGCFDKEDFHEYNVVKDIPAARKVFSEWPTRLVTSPFEVGIAINYPGTSVENDFPWAPTHPMVEAYRSYLPMPYDRPTWDLTSVLYGVEGASFFTESSSGTIEVTDEGSTVFTPSKDGNRYYLMVDSEQAGTIKNHFIEMVTARPKNVN